jgi:hypothetical protein
MKIIKEYLLIKDNIGGRIRNIIKSSKTNNMYLPTWLEIAVKITMVLLSVVAIKYVYELIKIIKNK